MIPAVELAERSSWKGQRAYVIELLETGGITLSGALSYVEELVAHAKAQRSKVSKLPVHETYNKDLIYGREDVYDRIVHNLETLLLELHEMSEKQTGNIETRSERKIRWLADMPCWNKVWAILTKEGEAMEPKASLWASMFVDRLGNPMPLPEGGNSVKPRGSRNDKTGKTVGLLRIVEWRK